MTNTSEKKIKAWCIPPINDLVSKNGWDFYTPIFLTKREALEHASKELVRPCTITYIP
jgi:hypothetical protein